MFRALRLSVISFAVGVACVPGERPPEAPLHGTLQPSGRAGPGRVTPFAVAFAAPTGTATSAAELSIVFSRPLFALGTAGTEPPPRIAMEPKIPGKWQWVGARALHFVPGAARLPGATRFTVEVPGETRSLDGATLGAPYRFSFETPRPTIVGTRPTPGEERLEPSTTFEIELSQPVEPARFEAAVKLVSERKGARRALAFTAALVDPASPKKLVVRPKAPLPKDSAIRLETGDGLVGAEGPLPAEPRVLAYRTYGPLTVARIDCNRDTPHGGCAPGSSVGVTLSNPVKLAELRRKVSLAPAAPFRVGGEDDELAEYLDLAAPLAAGTTYSLRIEGDLTDRYGQKLGAPVVREIRMDDHFPRVELGISGEALTPFTATDVPVGSVNVAAYDLVSASLAAADLPAFLDARDDGDARFAKLWRLPQAKTRKISPPLQKNQAARENVSIAEALGKRSGVLALGVRYAKDARDSRQVEPVRLLKVSDLGISAKVSRHGSLVWVTRLSTGAPVAKAVVELARTGVAPRRYETDVEGFARIPGSDFAPDFHGDGADTRALLLVRSGDDWTYEAVSDRLPEWRMPVPVDLSGAQRTYGLLFTERGVYRPGDVVSVKGIVREETPTGNATPAGKKLELELRSPDDEVVSKTPLATSPFGTFAAKLVVPETGHVGSWQIRAVGLGERPIEDGFEVAEYRPAEFKVAVESGAPSYVRGDTGRFTVRGEYLFGAPMAGANVHHAVSRGRTRYDVPGLEGFVTDAEAFYEGRSEAALAAGEIGAADGKLDPRGEAQVSARLDLPGQHGPELVHVDAEVTDVSRKAIASGTTAVVHPAAFYVGLGMPEDLFVAAPSEVTPKVVAVSPDGQRLAGKAVHVELTSRRWTLAREALSGGRTRAVTRVVDKVVSSCDVVSAKEPAPCRLAVQAPGYYVVVLRAKDARGNPSEAALGMYATGAAASGTLWGDDDRALVELVPNKKSYRPGDTAKVLVKMPFPEAQALVSVERAGVYRAERVVLKGPTATVSVPVTEDLRPNGFVSVHLLRPLAAKAQGAPYRVGYAELVVDPESRRLAVDVRPGKRELSPGEEVTVDVAVKARGGEGARAEVTLYAVDEGALMLTGYRTPDPVPVFTAPRALQVATVESRDSLAKISLDDFMAALGSEKGAEGGGGGGAGARRDFRETAYFNPSIVTDERGRATVRFKLPEGLTTYRLMAVAATEGDRYGFGSSSVVTSKRLMARPNLPRFLRAGDLAEAGVIVTSKHLGPARATVRAKTTGLLLLGPAEQTVDLPADSSVEVRFGFRADKTGSALLRFDVAAGPEHDAVEVARKISAPGQLETVSLYGATEGAVKEQLGDLSSIRRDTGGLEVTLAPSALVGLDGSAAQLVDYPYACTEQLASRLLPLLPLRELAQAFGFRLPTDAPALALRTVREILSRQQGDGGFGTWPDSTRSSSFVSAYAAWALDQAARSGAAVPKGARDRAHDYLRRRLAAEKDTKETLAAKAFAVDVLAEGGAPDPGYMTRLFERRAELPLFAQAFLLHAFVAARSPKPALDELLGAVKSQLRIAHGSAFAAENVGDEYAALLDSPARTSALVLRALVAAEPAHPLAPELARGLLEARRGGTWRTTQETAYALLALDAYRRAQEQRPAAFAAKVWLGAEVLGSTSFGGDLRAEHFVRPASALAKGASALVFDKSGPGTLFYEARLRYVPNVLPGAPLDEGFFVQKALRAVPVAGLTEALRTVAATGATRFRAGDLVITDLVVVTPSPRDFVVVDDPLPAGFEAVDARLATTAAWLGAPDGAAEEEPADDCGGEDCDGAESARDARAHGRAFGEAWYRREIRDDRVLFFVDHMPAGMYHYRYLARATTRGRFVVSPTKAEEMYTPESFGRTAAAEVTVE